MVGRLLYLAFGSSSMQLEQTSACTKTMDIGLVYGKTWLITVGNAAQQFVVILIAAAALTLASLPQALCYTPNTIWNQSWMERILI